MIFRRIGSSLTAVILLVTTSTVVAALALVSVLTVTTAERALFPALADKAASQTLSLRRTVQRALALEIPLESLVGVDALYDRMAASDPDLAFIAVESTKGAVLYVEGLTRPALRGALAAPTDPPPGTANRGQSLRGDHLITETPIMAGGVVVGRLIVGHDRSALMRPLTENLADIGVVFLVSVLLAFELMLLTLSLHVLQPGLVLIRILNDISAKRFGAVIGQRAGGHLAHLFQVINPLLRRVARTRKARVRVVSDPPLVSVRVLAFLFVFAEELARPFMPAYFATVIGPVGGMDPATAVGLVMALQMAGIAVAMPVASLFYHRFDRRRLYVLGALLASAGCIGTGFATDFWMLVGVRLLSAVGYALTFVACQGYVLDSTTQANRAQGTAMMVGGIMLADICGPAIGGILASHIGRSETFFLGAAMALVAAALVPSLMTRRPRGTSESLPALSWQTARAVLGNRSFVALLVFGAVPAKLLLTGFLFFLVPLTLANKGVAEADIGRAIMLYGLSALVLGPLLARVCDRHQIHAPAIVAGGLLSGLALCAMAWDNSLYAVAAAIAALGLGQALSISAQVTVATGWCAEAIRMHGQGPVMAVLRLVERLGGAIGPLAAAAMAATLGGAQAMGLLGVYALASALLFLAALLLRWGGGRGRRRDGAETMTPPPAQESPDPAPPGAVSASFPLPPAGEQP